MTNSQYAGHAGHECTLHKLRRREEVSCFFIDRCCCRAKGHFCIRRSYQKTHMINRRNFLQGSGAFASLSAMGLSACTRHVTAPMATGAPALPFYDAVGPIIPIRADMDRIFRITVCTRPFRPAGPRQDVERVGDPPPRAARFPPPAPSALPRPPTPRKAISRSHRGRSCARRTCPRAPTAHRVPSPWHRS